MTPRFRMANRVLMLTGDYSGDIHAAAVAKAVRLQNPLAEMSAVGGEQLQAEGVTLISNQSQMGRLGLGSLLGAPAHWVLGQKILRYAKNWKPNVVLLVDYGMFNLYMARQLKQLAKRSGQPLQVFYFIPPQVWASRRHRIKAIQAYVDHVFCIFPFETRLYQSYGIPVSYVGHPLVRELPPPENQQAFCLRYGLDPEAPILGIFPGSRLSEIHFLLDDMIGCASRLKQRLPNIQLVLAKAGSIGDDFLRKKLASACQKHQTTQTALGLTIAERDNHALLSVSTAVLLASGTVTLEAALYKTPMVIAYRLQPWVYAIAMRIMYLKQAGLPNILTNPDIYQPVENPLVPEILQNDLNPDNLLNALLPLFDSQSSACQKQKQAFETIQTLLSSDQSAAEQVAGYICNTLSQIESGSTQQ
jgi:lipid-A-disaccharide synthase